MQQNSLKQLQPPQQHKCIKIFLDVNSLAEWHLGLALHNRKRWTSFRKAVHKLGVTTGRPTPNSWHLWKDTKCYQTIPSAVFLLPGDTGASATVNTPWNWKGRREQSRRRNVEKRVVVEQLLPFFCSVLLFLFELGERDKMLNNISSIKGPILATETSLSHALAGCHYVIGGTWRRGSPGDLNPYASSCELSVF